jgi:3-deoxy-7-phosphoheptulonate synthase/chorismate mutase
MSKAFEQQGVEDLRKEIDQLNHEILALLNRRTTLVKAVRAVKDAEGRAMPDPGREVAQVQTLLLENPGPVTAKSIERIYREIFRSAVEDSVPERPTPMLAGSRPMLRRGGVMVGDVQVGGGAKPVMIAGPCSVESAEQMEETVRFLTDMGVRLIRGGCFKPRTSVFSFQGLGLEGLQILSDTVKRHGAMSVTELTSIEHLQDTAAGADLIQVGARSMFNYELLKKLGEVQRPILLKRHFAATVEEWLMAAEYLAGHGNDRIILCERGIRTFETQTRNTLDLSAVALIKERYDLPVVVDVSHAAGRRDILPALARAALAVGADGLMVEVHPNPALALSDSQQQLGFDDFSTLWASLFDRRGGC